MHPVFKQEYRSKCLIGLYSSSPRSGKSEIAKYLVENYGFVNLRFADTLKTMTACLLHDIGIDVGDIRDYIDGERKEEVLPIVNCTSRFLMVTLGTDWGRQTVCSDIWMKIVENKLQLFDRVVIDDVRFANEYRMVASNVGWLVKVIRDGERGDRGRSEGNLDNYPFDITLRNDKNGLEYLYKEIEEVLIPNIGIQ